ncbi:uncharacterized protein LOC117647751 [Thrips palmi]|uniref:Uncharacterized protein LOC117647751 n=1 Tax=Thrips palmi TaxID=161013 RepID=A0A6P8ZQB0_THRPL|nr:uncharacterized protein LOC117647751 [Thrips palmi]
MGISAEQHRLRTGLHTGGQNKIRSRATNHYGKDYGTKTGKFLSSMLLCLLLLLISGVESNPGPQYNCKLISAITTTVVTSFNAFYFNRMGIAVEQHRLRIGLHAGGHNKLPNSTTNHQGSQHGTKMGNLLPSILLCLLLLLISGVESNPGPECNYKLISAITTVAAFFTAFYCNRMGLSA